MTVFPRFIIILILSITFITGCSSFSHLSVDRHQMTQVPVTESPSGKVLQGKFIWHDLITPDIKLAGKFYTDLFGWDIKYINNYAVIRNNGRLIGGMLQIIPQDGNEKPAVWLPSVSVENIEQAVKRATDQGGKILNGPLDMDKRGRAALIRDTQGCDIVLLNAKGGDPDDTDAQPGDWLWDELWSNEPQSSIVFYRNLLAYDEVIAGEKYDVFLSNNKWRAGVRHLKDKDTQAQWVPVVRVADPEQLLKRVEELGGVVWVTPDELPGSNGTALIGDSSGALLLIQRWPSSNEK